MGSAIGTVKNRASRERDLLVPLMGSAPTTLGCPVPGRHAPGESREPARATGDPDGQRRVA